MVVVFMLREAGINQPFRMAKDLLPTIEEEVPEPYSEDELKRIFAAIEDDREYAAIMFFLVTACREKEVASAQWDDLKIIEGKPHYRVQAKESAAWNPDTFRADNPPIWFIRVFLSTSSHGVL